jgi:hypothetical protein
LLLSRFLRRYDRGLFLRLLQLEIDHLASTLDGMPKGRLAIVLGWQPFPSARIFDFDFDAVLTHRGARNIADVKQPVRPWMSVNP